MVTTLGAAAPAGAAVDQLGSGQCQCQGVASDSTGAIYTGDPSQHQVVKLDPAGNVVSRFGSFGSGPGQFSSPWAYAVDNLDNLYVGDGNNPTSMFTSGGTFVRSFGSFSRALAIDPARNVYVAESTQIFKFDSSGTQVGPAWTSGSGGNPTFSFLNGITYNPADGHVYAVDANTDKVMEWTADGTFVDSWGSSGTDPGQLREPSGLASDQSGNLYLAEPRLSSGGFGQKRIQKFTAGGSYLGVYDSGNFQPSALSSSGNRLYASVFQAGVLRIDLDRPVARIAPNTTQPQTSQLIRLDASSSLMPFGTVTRFEWDLDGDGSFETDTGADPHASARFATPATRTLAVRVTGSISGTDTAQAALNVRDSQAALSGPPKALTGVPMTWDASGSAVPDSAVLDYAWDLDGNGSFERNTTTPTISATYDVPGSVTARVRVTREGNRVDAAAATVAVVPSPPAGNVGVSINGGAFATNDRNVDVAAVWPPYSARAMLSNDGGFGAAGKTKVFDPVVDHMAWTLASTGNERLPKTVYLRYLGAGNDNQTYTDDIVLDETAPTVTSTPGPSAPTAPQTPTVKLTYAATRGSVAATPAGTECTTGSGCSATYAKGTQVTLRAFADDPAAVRFGGWTVNGKTTVCTNPSACTVTLNADTTARATFVPRPGAPLRPVARRVVPAARKLRKLPVYRLKVKAKDANTGIVAIEASPTKSRGTVVALTKPGRRGRRALASTVKVPLARKPRWLRVWDAAGNASRWRRIG